jgi:hypothetical protein
LDIDVAVSNHQCVMGRDAALLEQRFDSDRIGLFGRQRIAANYPEEVAGHLQRIENIGADTGGFIRQDRQFMAGRLELAKGVSHARVKPRMFE